jgi:hypothetical protein
MLFGNIMKSDKMEQDLIEALQKIATGEIVGESENYKDSLYLVQQIAKEAIDNYFNKKA